MLKILKTYFVFVLLALASCNEPIPEQQQIPLTLISEDVNLNHLQNFDLNRQGGYIYFDAGYKGLLIYHQGGGVYRVFERACTHDPHSDCTPLEVDDSGLFIIHKCCNSTFNFNGDVTNGPATLRLLEYQNYVDGPYIKIRNG